MAAAQRLLLQAEEAGGRLGYRAWVQHAWPGSLHLFTPADACPPHSSASSIHSVGERLRAPDTLSSLELDQQGSTMDSPGADRCPLLRPLTGLHSGALASKKSPWFSNSAYLNAI